MNINQTNEAGEMPEVRWCYDDHEQVFHYCDPQEVSAALSTARATESHLRAQLAEAEKERDGARAANADLSVSAARSAELANEANVVQQGWMARAFKAESERDAAQARVGELEALLKEARDYVSLTDAEGRSDAELRSNYPEAAEVVDDLADRIDAALATSPHRLAGRGE